MSVLIFFVILFILYFIICKIYDKLWLNNLDVSIILPNNTCFEGDEAELKEVIVNDKILPLPTLEIDFALDNGLHFINDENSSLSDKLYRRDVFFAGIKRKITRTLMLKCMKRGYYSINQVGLMSYNIFMSEKFVSNKNIFSDFYVYPARLDSRKVAVPYNKIMGEILNRQRLLEDPFEFIGIRDYTLRDPMKDINWKASAKTNNLVVNVHGSTISQKITLVLDTYDIKAPDDYRLSEESIRLVLALSERFLLEGINLNFIGNAHDLFSKETLNIANIKNMNISDIRGTFARLVTGEEMAITNYFNHIERDSLVIVVSKNIELVSEFNSLVNDTIIVIPHRYEPPNIPQSKHNVIFWEYKGIEVS